MEVLIYISGLLTTLIAVLITAAIKANKKYTTLLAANQSTSNISSMRYEDMREKIEDMKLLIMDIQSTMEKDQYESLSGINKELRVVSELALANNRKIGENAKSQNQTQTEILNQITLMKGNIKAMSQDQRGISRY
jgi:hypothetical protein